MTAEGFRDPRQAGPGDPLSVPPGAAPPRKGRRLQRIFVGAIVTFATMSLLFGVPNAGQMVALAVICTAGIGLIPILFLCWAVGWVVLEVWGSIAASRESAATP